MGWIVRKILPDGRAIEKNITDPSVASEWIDRAATDPSYEVIQVSKTRGGTTDTTTTTKPAVGSGEALARGIGQGASLGFSEELMGIGSQLGDWLASKTQDIGYTPSPRDYIREEREKESAAQESHPFLYGAGEVAGSFAAPIPGSTALRGAGALGRVGEAALVGGAYGLGKSEDKSVSDALIGAGLGAATGTGIEGALALKRGLGGKAVGKIKQWFPESEEEALIKARAKADVGPSREESAVAQVKAMREQQQALDKEREAANKLIVQHGEKIRSDLQDNIQINIMNDVNSIVESAGKVLDEAHTGLKGEMVRKSFAEHLARQPDDRRMKILKTAINKTKSILDNAEEVVNGIIDDANSGLIFPPGSKVKTFKKSIETHRTMLKDAESQANKFGVLYGKKKYAEAPKFMPESMQNIYIALDDMKKMLGKVHEMSGLDKATREKIEGLYENAFRVTLENPRLWGDNVANAQKELNGLWYRYLKLNPSIEKNLLTSKGSQTQSAANSWQTRGEAVGAKVKRLITNPDSPENVYDMRDLDDWLDAVYGLSGSLSYHYKPTEALQKEVANIARAREAVRQQFGRAREDLGRLGKIGVPAEEKAIMDAREFAARSLPKTENISEIERLKAVAERKSMERGRLGDEEQILTKHELEPTDVPALMKRRMDADKAYRVALKNKEEAYRDIERTPLERAGVKALRGAGTAGKLLGERRGRMIGLASGSSTDIIASMWGKRPIKTINKEADEEEAMKRAVNDRRNKGSKTTVVGE